MSKRYIVYLMLACAAGSLSACRFFSNGNDKTNVNEIKYSSNQLSLKGNATITVLRTDDDTASIRILNEDKYKVSRTGSEVYLYQEPGKGSSKATAEKDQYPRIEFRVPKKTTSLNLELLRNGDIILADSFDLSELAISLNGNGDISSPYKTKVGTCTMTLSGNGDITFNQIEAQTINTTLNGNGDILLEGTTRVHNSDNNADINTERLVILK
ncbi:GIN domain-containing protein [Edaphocola flava]|uniref:GIN domain-containing protein n=1 Tax=Edaphocola flava TaxID=2499629 RepID=UPI00100A5B56|nr:DUF2807 domain-containing protein [Edaphocola flava]